VDVEDATLRYVEQALAQDLTVCGNDKDVGSEGAEGFDGIKIADLLGLQDQQAALKRQAFDGRRRGRVPTPCGAIRLADYRDDIVLGIEQCLEAGQCEFGRAEENDAHRLEFSGS
jgi:hypothetical protein